MSEIEKDRDGKRLYQLGLLGGDPEPVLKQSQQKRKKEKSVGKPSRFRSTKAFEGTKLTTLAFSGGTGSGAIAEMLINGDLICETDLLITTADPGMEDTRTYDYIAEMGERFADAGLRHEVVKTSLYGEFLAAVEREDSRFDLPPFWTKNRETGKRGRLMQGCTQAYKIMPMKRITRDVLAENHGVGRTARNIGKDIVRTWIGFSADETSRIKEAPEKYIYFQYPLVALGLTKADVVLYYQKIGRPLPPRSVCSGCFANDLSHFRDMYENRKHNWEQAVAVDEACRNLEFMGVKDECYVSSTLTPLKDLPACDFKPGDDNLRLFDQIECQSGHCFI